MPYHLIKTRINTTFNRAIAPFQSAAAFDDFSQLANGAVTLAKPIAVLHLESATVRYSLAYRGEMYWVDVDIMQSTRKTTYCFDVFMRLTPTAESGELAQLVHHYQHQLDALRLHFNGKWIIADDDLSHSSLQ